MYLPSVRSAARRKLSEISPLLLSASWVLYASRQREAVTADWGMRFAVLHTWDALHQVSALLSHLERAQGSILATLLEDAARRHVAEASGRKHHHPHQSSH